MPASEIMHKFKAGTLRSSSGQKVTNPAQARAIAASYGKREHNSPMPLPPSLKIPSGGGEPELRRRRQEVRKMEARRRSKEPAKVKKSTMREEARGAMEFTKNYWKEKLRILPKSTRTQPMGNRNASRAYRQVED